MKLTRVTRDNPIQGTLSVWTCPTPGCQHKERDIHQNRQRRDIDGPKGWRPFWKKRCEMPKSIESSRCMICQLRDWMLESEARRKATSAAKSYGWTVLEKEQRKQRRKTSDNVNNYTSNNRSSRVKNTFKNYNNSRNSNIIRTNTDKNGGRSARRASSYQLYGEVLQMLPADEFNEYVKGLPSSMVSHNESKRDNRPRSSPPKVRRRPPPPKLSLIIPGGGRGGAGGRAGRKVQLVYPAPRPVSYLVSKPVESPAENPVENLVENLVDNLVENPDVNPDEHPLSDPFSDPVSRPVSPTSMVHERRSLSPPPYEEHEECLSPLSESGEDLIRL